MYYVIQEGLFREQGTIDLIEILERHQLEHEFIKFRPFVEELELKTKRTDVWIFGSVNLSKKIGLYKLSPGTMDNTNHDFEVYASYYKENMLNSDGVIIRFGQELPKEYSYFFARPTKDTKSFSGQLFSREKWEKWQQDMADNNLRQQLREETKVLIASLKSTQVEIRCWIIDGKVITTSQYKLGDRVISQNTDNWSEPGEFAQRMADIFCPARAFVLDVCLCEDEWRVVEINCINSAGFYDGDISKLIQAIEEAFNT